MNVNNENHVSQKPDNVNEEVNLNKQDPSLDTEPKRSPWGDIFLGLGLSYITFYSNGCNSLYW